MSKTKKIEVLSREVLLYQHREEDFISLTDIARYRDAERGDYIIQNWMRNRNTIEFLGIWEQLNNPDFNSIEFDGIKERGQVSVWLLHGMRLKHEKLYRKWGRQRDALLKFNSNNVDTS